MNKPFSKSFGKRCSVVLALLFGVVCGCNDSGGGSYNSVYSSGGGYYDPWYHHGGYYDYDDIYVPAYPDRNPDNLPDRGDRPHPEHPIVKPDRPNARPSLPSNARPATRPSFSGGGMSRGGMRGGGMRGGRGGGGRR